jgi:RNA polymerase sigma-70 factor (ECF subfamily)
MTANPTGDPFDGSIWRVTEDELVRRASDGDVDAFDQLVQRHQAAVFRAALAALGMAEDAEEVAQDAFVRAWQSLRRFRGESSFRTWILTIVWRRALSRRRTVGAWWRRRVALGTGDDPPAAARTDDQVSIGELRQEIKRAIAALSPKLKDALLLAQSGEYDYEEIAAMLGTTRGTVKWRVAEARRRVRLHLGKVGYDRT